MLHALHRDGLSYSEIARRTGYERRSVAKWLKFEAPPDRRRVALKPTSPWYFETFLAQCWKDGNRCGRHLFHDVKQRGYTGSFANLERLLGAWRRAERGQTDEVPPTALKSEPVRDSETGHAISPVVAAALCIKPRNLLTERQVKKVDVLKQGSDAFAEMRRLASIATQSTGSSGTHRWAMTDEARRSLAKARFIRGSINDLIKLMLVHRVKCDVLTPGLRDQLGIGRLLLGGGVVGSRVPDRQRGIQLVFLVHVAVRQWS